MIRKCPRCGLIWIKTEVCDGATTCGKKGQYFDVEKTNAYKFLKYVYTYVGGKLECLTNSIPEPKPEKITVTITRCNIIKARRQFRVIWTSWLVHHLVN